MKLDQIIRDCCNALNVTEEVAAKLVQFIDLQKVQGQTGGYALSKFGDYLGFLRLLDNEASLQFFASRWEDHLVRIEVPQTYMKYLNSDALMFTPSRLEPQYNKVPFYDAGIEKVPTGVSTNPHNEGTIRKAPDPREAYENFIIEQFLPKQFFIEMPNAAIPTVISEGLPAVTFDKPYPLHLTEEEARRGLSKHLHNVNHRMATKADLMSHTLLCVTTSELEVTADLLFTRNDMFAGSSRSGGYFYIGKIPAKAIKVADQNIT